MHPVEANEYLVTSRPLEEWVNCCSNVVQTGLPGRVTVGNNRVGKTKGTQWLFMHKDALFGEAFPLIVMPQRYHELTSAKKFFSHLLESAGHALPKGDETILRQRTKELLVDMSSRMQFPRVVLIIDEAEWLELSHYNLLINITNELDTARVRLIVFPVGHTELGDTVTRYQALGRNHITGRFMSGVFEFRGVESADELAHIFRQYDERLFYPRDSGISFTRAFAGDRFSQGFRLAHLANGAWSAMEAKRERAMRPGKLSVGMQTVTLLANELLLRLAGQLEPPFIVEPPQWDAVLDEIGFLSLEA